MKRTFRIGAILVVVLAATAVIWAQNDPRIGTWKLNVAKSKFDPAATRTSETRTYESSGGSISAHSEMMDSNGKKHITEWNGTPDGKDYPYTGEPNGADTISAKHLGNGFASQSKKAGKVLYTTTSKFSSDGKVMTLTTKGVNADSKPLNSMRVYDKQ